MRAKPLSPPSLGAKARKYTLKETFNVIKSDRNIWLFLLGYMIIYGTVISLGSLANLIFKPYGFKDIEIAIFAVCIILFGVFGSIIFTFYLKKSESRHKYKKVVTLSTVLTFLGMGGIMALLNLDVDAVVVAIAASVLGFIFTPLVPVSYDLGC